MREYTEQDGLKMKWNVLSVPLEKSVLDVFPDLARIFDGMRDELLFSDPINDWDKKETPELTPNQIVRYIVLVYHIKSPLIQYETDILWRKKRAMLLAGAEVNAKGFFSQWVNQVIGNINSYSRSLVMRFLRFEDSIDWVELCSLTELYFDYQQVISEETVGTDKKSSADIMDKKLAARTKSKGLKDEMKALSVSLFRDDVDLMNYVGSTITKEDIRSRLTPESRVKRR